LSGPICLASGEDLMVDDFTRVTARVEITWQDTKPERFRAQANAFCNNLPLRESWALG
jgi:hypothetical protein